MSKIYGKRIDCPISFKININLLQSKKYNWKNLFKINSLLSEKNSKLGYVEQNQTLLFYYNKLKSVGIFKEIKISRYNFWPIIIRFSMLHNISLTAINQWDIWIIKNIFNSSSYSINNYDFIFSLKLYIVQIIYFNRKI